MSIHRKINNQYFIGLDLKFFKEKRRALITLMSLLFHIGAVTILYFSILGPVNNDDVLVLIPRRATRGGQGGKAP